MNVVFMIFLAAAVWHAFVDAPLQGNVSNEKGKIGIREDWDRRIVRVHPGSPAELAGLKVGDKVIEVDGHKGDYPIIGGAKEVVKVVVDRKGQTLTFYIRRIPTWQIK